MTSADSLYEAGHPESQCSGTTQRDRVGREVGGGLRIGGQGSMYSCGRFMLMHGRNHHNIVIILQLKLINFFRKDPKNDGSWQEKWDWKQPWQRGQPQ